MNLKSNKSECVLAEDRGKSYNPMGLTGNLAPRDSFIATTLHKRRLSGGGVVSSNSYFVSLCGRPEIGSSGRGGNHSKVTSRCAAQLRFWGMGDRLPSVRRCR